MHNILLNGISNYNIALFYSINNGMNNPVFNIIMPILTNFGSLIAYNLVCVLIFIFGGQYSKKVAILGLLALFLSSAAVLILKYIVAEPRPFAVLNNIHLLAIENDYSHLATLQLHLQRVLPSVKSTASSLKVNPIS